MVLPYCFRKVLLPTHPPPSFLHPNLPPTAFPFKGILTCPILFFEKVSLS